MRNRVQTCVVIAGGGPAAAALAVELRRLGVECLVVAQPRPRQCFEGMSERTAQMLGRLDFVHCLDSLRPPGPRHAVWNGAASRHNREHLVERGALDRALLADLRRQGVTVLETPCRAATRDGDAWMVHTDQGPLRAAFLVEARGRAAPAGGTAAFRGPATVAVGRLYRAPADADSTTLSPFADGWAWSSRGRDGIASLQFTLAADTVAPAGKSGLTALHQHLATTVAEAAELLPAGAEPLGEAFARDCTSYLRDDVAAPGFLRVGDAACGLDPLSGQGVFLALAGALSAAAVVNTCVNRPDQAAAAQDFHRRRVAGQFFDKVALGRDFYAQERRWAERAFWRDRAVLALPAAAPCPVGFTVRPVLENGWVVEREVLLTPGHPLGVWRLDDVPVVELARARAADPDFSAAAYAARTGQDSAAVHRASAWLDHVLAPAS